MSIHGLYNATGTYEDMCVRNRYQGQEQLISSHSRCGIRLIGPALSACVSHTSPHIFCGTTCFWTNVQTSCKATVYPKKYAHGFCFAVLCCGYTLNDFPISIRLTSLALWQSNDCPSASKATLMNMDKYFMWIHYERLHNHNKAKHNKTVCIFLGIYCIMLQTDFMPTFIAWLIHGWCILVIISNC